MASKKKKGTLDQYVDQIVGMLKRREVNSSTEVAVNVCKLLRAVVRGKWRDVAQVRARVRQIGRLLQAARPLELVIENTVRRILFFIRQEVERKKMEDSVYVTPPPSPDLPPMPSTPAPNLDDFAPSLMTTFANETPRSADGPGGSAFEGLVFDGPYDDIKEPVMTAISELIDELETVNENISDHALEYIHANEIIMTFGASDVVRDFLLRARQTRQFEVIVAETAPSYAGQELSLELADAGIDTTLITDSATLAMMPRVNKVISGCHAMMANGGCITTSGGHLIALAAQRFSIPFVVLSGLENLNARYPYDQDTVNNLVSPEHVLSFEDGELADNVKVVNPVYDYIPPELISLYITDHDDFGGLNPSYVYRLLSEYYDPDDLYYEESAEVGDGSGDDGGDDFDDDDDNDGSGDSDDDSAGNNDAD